jgi:hypothetical protein
MEMIRTIIEGTGAVIGVIKERGRKDDRFIEHLLLSDTGLIPSHSLFY